MVARLTLYQTNRPIRRLLLDRNQRYLIGRDDACNVAIEDAGLSRRHARVEYSGGQWELTDLCSKNGTLVGGRNVARCPLTVDTWFELGGILAHFDEISDSQVEEMTRRHAERWETSVQASRKMQPGKSPDELLSSIIESFVEVADAERGFILLGDDLAALDPAEGRETEAFAGSRSVIVRTLQQGCAVVSSDLRGDPMLAKQPSIVSGGISGCVCMPLRIGEQIQGLIYVDSREQGKQFTDLDMEILEALAHHASMVIGVSRLRDDIVDLSALLPDEIERERPADSELLLRLTQLLPKIDRPAPRRVAVAAADR